MWTPGNNVAVDGEMVVPPFKGRGAPRFWPSTTNCTVPVGVAVLGALGLTGRGEVDRNAEGRGILARCQGSRGGGRHRDSRGGDVELTGEGQVRECHGGAWYGQ